MLPNINSQEINKFAALADTWWDANGPMRMLHRLNPIRLQYIQINAPLLKHYAILDVGCGGGILTESLAQYATCVTGIDMAEDVIDVAKQHANMQQLAIEYSVITVEALAQQQPESFDVITCMELLEHVPNPASIIQAIYTLLKPGGHAFFSTINRNLPSYAVAILGAEYLLKILPLHTHNYAQFIKPSELNHWSLQAGLYLCNISGINYNLFTRSFTLSSKATVNYVTYYQKL